MRKILCELFIISLTVSLISGCKSHSDKRILYNTDLSEYVQLGNYHNIDVNTESEDFKKYYNNVMTSDISENELYVRRTGGVVSNGDTVNIDYTGTKDGKTFDGGTAVGRDLKIGSNTFIDGFESALIGVEIGKTVDFNLTATNPYSPNRNITDSIFNFKVKINYVKSEEIRNPEDYYNELGYSSVEDYYTDVKMRAIENYIVDTIQSNSKIKKYPEKDLETIFEAYEPAINKEIERQYGINLSAYLNYTSQTEEEYKNSIINTKIKPIMDTQLVIYSIFDNENLEISDNDILSEIDMLKKQSGNTHASKESLEQKYGCFYFEYLAVKDKVIDLICSNSNIF